MWDRIMNEHDNGVEFWSMVGHVAFWVLIAWWVGDLVLGMVR